MKRRKQLTAALLSLCLLLAALPFNASAMEADAQAASAAETEAAPAAEAAAEEVPDPEPEAPAPDGTSQSDSVQPEEEASAEEAVNPTADAAAEEASDAETEDPANQPMTAAATVFTGKCGANATYKLDVSTKTLTISGSGAIEDYDQAGNAPWNSQSEESRIAASNVTTLVVSSGITRIGNYTFAELSSLAQVTLPDGLLTIGDNAFKDDSGLWEIKLPSTVTELGSGAFSFAGLTSVSMSRGLKKIGSYAFLCCDFTAVTVPEGVTELGEGAFMSCLNLTSVSLPGTLLTIGDGAFIYSALTSLTLPTKLTSVGEMAFFGCPGLYSVTIPASVTTIGEMAFGYANMDDGSDDYGIYEDFVISGTAGSAAEAYAKENGIPFQNISTVTKLSTPTLTRVENVEGGIRVSWKAVTDAASYLVYYSTDGGKSWKSPRTATGTSYTFSDLPSGTVYNFTVRAVNGSVKSGYQKPGLSLRYLATPTLSSAANASTGVRVSWKAVSGATSYRVYYSTNGGKTWKSYKTATGTSYIFSGLTSSQKYFFTVRAVNGSTLSGYNHTGLGCFYIEAPQMRSASASGSTATVTWKQVANATSYVLYYSTNGGKNWKQCGSNSSYLLQNGNVIATVTGLTPGQTYHFTARAYQTTQAAAPSGYQSPGVSVTISATPVLTRADCTDKGITVRWGAVANAASYRVYCSTDGGKTWKNAQTASGTSYTYTGLKSGQKYTFTVRAKIGGKLSGYSKTGISCVYLSVPQLIDASYANSKVTVRWKPVSGAESYRIYYRVSGSKSWTKVNSYTYSSGKSTCSGVISNLPSGQTYQFTVRAYKKPSLSAYQTPGVSTAVGSTTPVLTKAECGADGIRVYWNTVSGATEYRVYASTDGGKTWGSPKKCTSTPYLYTGLTSGQKYTFTVRAMVNGKLTGYNKTGVSCVYLSVPHLLSASTSGISATVTWKAVSGAETYAFYYSTDGGNHWKRYSTTFTSDSVSGTVSVTITGLSPDTNYAFTVRACKGSAMSRYESGIDAHTSA